MTHLPTAILAHDLRLWTAYADNLRCRLAGDEELTIGDWLMAREDLSRVEGRAMELQAEIGRRAG